MGQFREIEFLLGFKRPEVLGFFRESDLGYERIQRRLSERSVIDRFYEFLAAQGASVPAQLLGRDLMQPNPASEPLQQELLRLYKCRPDLAILFERMMDFDEGLQEWRYRHVKIVERTIGAKRGTGGSPGVEFLKKTLFQPVFADLWAIRHLL